MTSDLTAGETVYIDRALKAEFIRYCGPNDANAIVRLGLDSRVVSAVTLFREEQ